MFEDVECIVKKNTDFVCSSLNWKFVVLFICFIWLLIMYSMSYVVMFFARYGSLWLVLLPERMKNPIGKVFVGVETMKQGNIAVVGCSELLTERNFEQWHDCCLSQ